MNRIYFARFKVLTNNSQLSYIYNFILTIILKGSKRIKNILKPDIIYIREGVMPKYFNGDYTKNGAIKSYLEELINNSHEMEFLTNNSHLLDAQANLTLELYAMNKSNLFKDTPPPDMDGYLDDLVKKYAPDFKFFTTRFMLAKSITQHKTLLGSSVLYGRMITYSDVAAWIGEKLTAKYSEELEHFAIKVCAVEHLFDFREKLNAYLELYDVIRKLAVCYNTTENEILSLPFDLSSFLYLLHNNMEEDLQYRLLVPEGDGAIYRDSIFNNSYEDDENLQYFAKVKKADLKAQRKNLTHIEKRHVTDKFLAYIDLANDIYYKRMITIRSLNSPPAPLRRIMVSNIHTSHREHFNIDEAKMISSSPYERALKSIDITDNVSDHIYELANNRCEIVLLKDVGSSIVENGFSYGCARELMLLLYPMHNAEKRAFYLRKINTMLIKLYGIQSDDIKSRVQVTYDFHKLSAFEYKIVILLMIMQSSMGYSYYLKRSRMPGETPIEVYIPNHYNPLMTVRFSDIVGVISRIDSTYTPSEELSRAVYSLAGLIKRKKVALGVIDGKYYLLDVTHLRKQV